MKTRRRISLLTLSVLGLASTIWAQNPIITHKYTADPAALVHNDKVYLYVGHDEAKAHENHYVLNEWLIFSSDDMVNWTEEAAFPASAFEWAKGEAWAAHVVEKEGKFYWYVTVEHGTIPGKSIGVAVSDSPTGPFKDALGKALITNDMTTEHSDSYWDDIDPAVFIDDDGEAYMYWGNVVCYWVRLNDNMIELDGPIQTVDLPHFTEAPYIHKKDEWYYLTYAYMFPERTAYARSKSVTGPWEFVGLLNRSKKGSVATKLTDPFRIIPNYPKIIF